MRCREGRGEMEQRDAEVRERLGLTTGSERGNCGIPEGSLMEKSLSVSSPWAAR